jgi:large subunit ribosomal protein L17
MRHQKHTFKVGRDSAHRRALIANLLKALVEHDRIQTTVTKAKELKRHADRLVTLAKKGTLASRRNAIAKLMISSNALTPKEARALKEKKDQSVLNGDTRVMEKLFNDLAKRFANRAGGYTRILRTETRVGDNAQLCMIEYLSE